MDVVPWLGDDSASWWESVCDWVQATTELLGFGPARVSTAAARMRPWGVTVPIETAAVQLFFKATEPKRCFELTIMQSLGGRLAVARAASPRRAA